MRLRDKVAPVTVKTSGAVLTFTRSVAVELAGANIFHATAAGGIPTPPTQACLASTSVVHDSTAGLAHPPAGVVIPFATPRHAARRPSSRRGRSS